MANVYDLIKRHKNIRYYLVINRVNSAEGYIEAENRDGTNETVATIKLKTNKVVYNKELPDEVKEAIEHVAKN